MSLVLSLLSLLTTFSAEAATKAPLTFPATGIKTILVSVPKGSIKLSSVKNQKELMVNVIGENKKCVQSIGLENSQLFVKISSENILFEKADCHFDVEVTVPVTQTFDMDLSSGSAAIKVKDMNGVLNLKTATGSVDVSGDVLKDVTAKSATGNMNFQYKTCSVRADLDFLSATGKTSVKLPGTCKIRVDYSSATGKLFNGIGESEDYQVKISGKSASGDLNIAKNQ